MELQVILDAIKEKPELLTGILPVVIDTEVGKKLVTDRAEIIYKEKIGDEVNKIHSQYDDDIFNAIGKRPTTKDGVKEKTYDFLKNELTNYKKLLDLEGTLNADQKVIALNKEIERLKSEGGGKHVQEIFDQAAANWKIEKDKLDGEIATLKQTSTDGLKAIEISKATAGLKYNPDISETLRNMALKNAENDLLKNSKIEDGKVVFLNAEGKPILNSLNTAPATAAEVLAGLDGIKEITLKADTSGGGGAPPIINGKVETVKVEGKDVKRLNLGPKGTFKTKMEFTEAKEKALADSGVTRMDPEWSALENSAYAEHDVANLPTE